MYFVKSFAAAEALKATDEEISKVCYLSLLQYYSGVNKYCRLREVPELERVGDRALALLCKITDINYQQMEILNELSAKPQHIKDLQRKLHLGWSVVTKHLIVLKECGFVKEDEQVGRMKYHRLDGWYNSQEFKQLLPRVMKPIADLEIKLLTNKAEHEKAKQAFLEEAQRISQLQQ